MAWLVALLCVLAGVSFLSSAAQGVIVWILLPRERVPCALSTVCVHLPWWEQMNGAPGLTLLLYRKEWVFSPCWILTHPSRPALGLPLSYLAQGRFSPATVACVCLCHLALRALLSWQTRCDACSPIGHRVRWQQGSLCIYFFLCRMFAVDITLHLIVLWESWELEP